MRTPGAKAFLIHNSKFLLVLRDNKPSIPFPNTWDLPGGRIEKGETPKQALRRELKEELNIDPEEISYLDKQPWEDGSQDGGVIFHHFAKLSNEEYKNIRLGDEGQRFDFFDFEEAVKLNLVNYLKDYLQSPKNLPTEIM